MKEDCLIWVAKRLEDLRENKGVSAREMSRRINRDETYIRQIETGKLVPSISVLFEICSYLGITVKDFFSDEVENPELLNELFEILRTLNKHELESITSIVEIIAEKKASK
ncbi:MAG: helix-turn-helix domain-containing protein [Defluviitaleaceae bacterium]|nr:helix-turn-helix domain-containing protein [Defluviitaleaceae bacterium]